MLFSGTCWSNRHGHLEARGRAGSISPAVAPLMPRSSPRRQTARPPGSDTAPREKRRRVRVFVTRQMRARRPGCPSAAPPRLEPLAYRHEGIRKSGRKKLWNNARRRCRPSPQLVSVFQRAAGKERLGSRMNSRQSLDHHDEWQCRRRPALAVASRQKRDCTELIKKIKINLIQTDLKHIVIKPPLLMTVACHPEGHIRSYAGRAVQCVPSVCRGGQRPVCTVTDDGRAGDRRDPLSSPLSTPTPTSILPPPPPCPTHLAEVRSGGKARPTRLRKALCHVQLYLIPLVCVCVFF